MLGDRCDGVTVGNSACFTLLRIVRDSSYCKTTDVGSKENNSCFPSVERGAPYKQV